MSENNKFLVAITGIALMIVIGVGLVFWAMRNEREVTVIGISLSGDASSAVDFNDLAMIPGQKTEYTVRFASYSSKRYGVTLDFFEDEDKKAYNTLKHYVRVRIEVGDEVLCDDVLERVMEGDPLGFNVDIRQRLNTEMKVTYYLPDDIGNEAKGAQAAFKLLVVAGNEDPAWDWD